MENNSYINENGSKIVFWAAAIVLFLPIIVLPPYFQPSDWTRAMLFRVIITGLLAWLLFGFFYKKNTSVALPRWNVRLYLPFLILAAFIITLIGATLFSQDVSFSIFGSPKRAGGLLHLLFLFLFSVLIAIFINKNQWEKLFHVLFITGGVASLLAAVQYFNIFKNIFIAYEEGSTPSVLGNSTVLAMYMLFVLFLAFVFFIQGGLPKKKIFYGALCVLFAFTIIITGSRAAYLALLAGFLYFFLFYPYSRKFKLLRVTAAALVLSAITTIALLNIFPQLGQTNRVVQVIANRVSIQRIATDIFGNRLSAWKITWQAIQDKPLLGWGPENFYIGFEKHYNPVPFVHPTLLWDRPHNILLDVAASSGLVSMALYAGFWIALFGKLNAAKRFQKEDARYPENPLRIHGLQAMFIGYLTVLFFNFDSFASYIISFFFIGYSFFLIAAQKEKIVIGPPATTILQKKSLAAAALAAVIFFAWFWNIKPLYLNEKIVHAKNLSSEGHCKKALDISNNEDWAKAGIIKPYAVLLYVDIVKNCITPEEEVKYSQKMVSLLAEIAKTRPAFSRTWLFMGGFTNILAARSETKDSANKLLQEAQGYFKKALELSPKRQEPFAELGKNYLIAQNYEGMKKTGQACIAIDPRFGECYWQMGLAQIFLGQQEEGKKNIELALQNGYNYNPGYKQLAVAYMSQKNWTEAVGAYEKYHPRETSAAASYHATLAFLYEKVGNYQKAVEHALEVFRIQPENPETVLFIKLLLGKKPNDPTLHSSLAFIYMHPGPQQELSKAKAIYLQLIKNDPQNMENYLLELLNIYYELKEYNQAYQTALSVITLNPKLKGRIESFIKMLPKRYWEAYVVKFPTTPH